MKRGVFFVVISVMLAVVPVAGPPAIGAPQEQAVVVTSTANSGAGTLREALERATPGTIITFDRGVFPPDEPATIAVMSSLPQLAQGQVTIDGSSAGVILDGSQLPREDPVPGLSISSDGNIIKGLHILHFPASGVGIVDGARNNLIGGAGPGEGNVISGNHDGVNIVGTDTMSNTLTGNLIGTNASGTAALGNLVDGVWIGQGAQHNVVGGTMAAERNVISGNASNGVVIQGSGTMSNTVSGNYIGTDHMGTAGIGNAGQGVVITEGAQHNLVGGPATGARNIISGNAGDGVNMIEVGTTHNLVLGNFIGLDVSGSRPLPNSHGVSITGGASHNTVQGNVISGHEHNPNIVLWDPDTSFNVVIGNLIGTDATGALAVPSAGGIGIRGGASDNRIGGAAPGEGNVISGNSSHGIDISWGSARNHVVGNLIGTDITGTSAIPNGMGILITDAPNNTIGGNRDGERNVISGNAGPGLQISGVDSVENVILGNYIGTDAGGTEPLGNLADGVVIDGGAGQNIIGPENIIANSSGSGVRVQGSDTLGNTITGNSIYHNDQLGIQNLEGGNAEISPPIITDVGTRFIRGTAPPNSSAEIFSDEEDEARIFEGSTIADEGGDFAFRIPLGRFTGPNLTTSTIDAEGNTSQFSPPESPPAPVLTRELPDIVAPMQVSVEPKVIGTNLGLALFCVLFFGLTSTVFNSILEDYRDELVDSLGRFVPRPLADVVNSVGSSIRGMTGNGAARLPLAWLTVLLATSVIESFLDPQVGVLSPERLGMTITLFISAAAVSGLELASDLYAHRRWAPRIGTEGKIQWIGLIVAVVCVLLSRALDFKPGYLYGMVGAMYLMPDLAGLARAGKRAVFVLLTILTAGFILWISSAFLPTGLAELEPLFLTIFLISLQGVFFELFPLAVTDGGDIWSWRKGVWLVSFSIVFFCFYHFLLNPSASDVQALQQNGVQTLLLLIVIFGLATLILWLLFPLRLRRKTRTER